jgi:DNA-binding SARP family transcriptional activator
MLWLKALGGLALASGDGLVTGALTQRRRLALMALLAVARDRGISRDKVVAYLWSESDTERARHALNQLLHTQRKQFAPGDLFLGGKTLQLNAAVIRTDVGEFECALDRGALEEAVAMWGGPFLDGFFLRDAPAFEHWVDEQRDRLARRLCAACVDLATQAAAQGAPDRSAQWWRRAADIDPLDSQIALSVVQALAAMGNPAGAMRHAQLHRERLRDELGIAPDARLEAFVGRLQSVDTPRPATS